MTTQMTTQMTTNTLDIPGAALTYDVRRSGASSEPPLFAIGPAMAAGFAALRSHFGDRTVTTYDPRGSGRSGLTNPDRPITPDDRRQPRGLGQPRKPNAT